MSGNLSALHAREDERCREHREEGGAQHDLEDRIVEKRVPLREGEQHTIPPDTLHWFRAGDEGAIVSEFSTRSRDESDVFTDARIVR